MTVDMSRPGFFIGDCEADGVLWLAHSFSTLESLKDELLIGTTLFGHQGEELPQKSLQKTGCFEGSHSSELTRGEVLTFHHLLGAPWTLHLDRRWDLDQPTPFARQQLGLG